MRKQLKRKPDRGLYAGVDGTAVERPVYIGGDYYQDSAQIHLRWDEAERLASWLTQAVDAHKRAVARTPRRSAK